MRVTSSMMTNNMMINVNRGMRNLWDAEMMWSSGRRIQVPSDNPLIAARHMKFRNNKAANEDFQRNVENALAWMDITEAALDGVLRTLLNQIRDLVNTAHNDYNVLENRNAIVTQLNHLRQQIGNEMNTRMAGRYVFSGLRTDQPPLFTQEQPLLSFRITQNFNLVDIERTRSLQIFQPELDADGNVTLPHPLPIVRDPIHILKLAYNNIDLHPSGAPNITITDANGTPFVVRMRDLSDPNAYNANNIDLDGPVPGPADPEYLLPGEVIFIRETGELIFRTDDVTGATGSARFPISITYEKTGFARDELNPVVYFDTTLLYAPAGHSMRHLVGQSFNMNKQDMLYEFSTHTTIPVNVQARNVLTDKLYADLVRLVNFITDIRPTDRARLTQFYRQQNPQWTDHEIETAVGQHLSEETTFINAAMNSRFNNMLFLIDRHAAGIREQVTDIGSRARRLELMQNRLEQDEGSLERLYTNNIAVDMARVTTLLATAEARYMAAIRVGTNIINITLANFLQV